MNLEIFNLLVLGFGYFVLFVLSLYLLGLVFVSVKKSFTKFKLRAIKTDDLLVLGILIGKELERRNKK